MRDLFDSNSYLVPVCRKYLFIDKIVYLENHGCFLPRLVFAFDRDKDTSIILRSSHYTCVSYPIDKIYEVVYL